MLNRIDVENDPVNFVDPVGLSITLPRVTPSIPGSKPGDIHVKPMRVPEIEWPFQSSGPDYPTWKPSQGETHPDAWDEGEALNCPPDPSCPQLAWSIDVLVRQLKFRRWVMQRHGGGDRGHRKFYNDTEKTEKKPGQTTFFPTQGPMICIQEVYLRVERRISGSRWYEIL